jgi:hypothetical protein
VTSEALDVPPSISSAQNAVRETATPITQYGRDLTPGWLASPVTILTSAASNCEDGGRPRQRLILFFAFDFLHLDAQDLLGFPS